MNRTFVLLFFSIVFFSCSSKPENKEIISEVTNATEPNRQVLENSNRDAFGEIILLKQQVENGELSRVDSLIKQMQAQQLKDSISLKGEEGLYSIKLNREQLIEFIKSLNSDSLKERKSFEKNYTFKSTPKSYRPESQHCPDLIVLSVDEEDKRNFQILLNKSYYIDEDIGCSESGVIYQFKVEQKGIVLSKVDYAG